MCIIIVKPAGISLEEKVYRECWSVHDDGMGIAYVDEEKNDLVVSKGFMEKEEAIKAIKALEQKHLLIHFRRISRGAKSEENCHPFLVRSRVDEETKQPLYSFAIAHNGTIDVATVGQQSDTAAFIETILGPQLERDPWFMQYYHSTKLIEMAVGPRNKLVALRYNHETKKLDTLYINKNAAGTNERHGCWFSNYSWLPIAQVYGNAGHMHGDWEGYGGTGYGYNGTRFPLQQHQGNLNFPKSGNAFVGGGDKTPKINGAHHEYLEDHLGWRWDGEERMFVNEGTGGRVSALSYRKAFDVEYTYQGVRYYRNKRKLDANGKPVIKSIMLPAPDDKNTNGTGTPDDSKSEKAGENSPVPSIEVPRDPGVIDEDEPMTDAEIQARIDREQQDSWDVEAELGEVLDKFDLSHLSRREKKEIRRRSAEYVVSIGGQEALKELSPNEMIKWTRMAYIEAYPSVRAKGIEFIDRCLINGSFLKMGTCDIQSALAEKTISNIEIGGE